MIGELVENRLQSIGSIEHTATGDHLYQELCDTEVVEASVLADGRLLAGEREGPCSRRGDDERLSLCSSLP